MEILITASIGLAVCNEQHYLQIITAENETHYFVPIQHTQAIKMAGDEGLEIGDMPELHGILLEPVDSMMVAESLVDNGRRKDMLTGALEGGSNYWYFLTDSALAIINKYHGGVPREPLVDKMWRAIEAGESIPIHDADENNGNPLGHINLQSIVAGEIKMMKEQPDHYADIIKETDDATTADVWFQLAVMGKLVFG